MGILILGRCLCLTTAILAPFIYAAPTDRHSNLNNAYTILSHLPVQRPPYCEPDLSNLNQCTFSYRANDVFEATEMWAYDLNCVEIGYNPAVPLPVERFAFDSQLLHAIIVSSWEKPWDPLKIAYNGTHYDSSSCYNGGPAATGYDPNFTPGCFMNFRC